MTKMVERMAEVLFRRVNQQPWTWASEKARDVYLGHARAFIAEMREADDDMLTAALHVTRDPDYGHVADITAGAVWRRMIDTALEQPR